MIGVKYFKQLKPGMCGAAALQMIYDYYGNSIDQNNIWNSIKVPRRSGGEYITSTKLLALHAINLGYPTILVRGDLTTLQTLLLQDIPPIVCQQLSENNPLKGHFRVILGINRFIILHDPQFGKELPYSKDKFNTLWQRSSSEVTGSIVIGISKKDKMIFEKDTCPFCGKSYYRWTNGQGITRYLCPHCDRDLE